MPGPPRSWSDAVLRVDTTLRRLAFPASRAERSAAAEDAAALPGWLRTLPGAQRHRGDETGIEFTASRHSFDLGTATWLTESFPGDVEVDWSAPRAAEAAATLLRPAVTRLEEDGFDSDALTMHAWIRRARGDGWPSDLAWMLDALRDTGDALPRRAAAWEAAALPLRWQLRGSGVLSARLDNPAPILRAHLRAAARRSASFVAAAVPATLRPRLLPPPRARAVIRVARRTLAARCREVHALSYANPREVWYADRGAGTALAVIGVEPTMRLALEGNYAFMLFANGVPVGYGGVSPFGAQANTGLNVFPAFRGTEASALWLRTLRSFHALFGVHRFVVNPFQVGAGNREAMASGAFWFYYRLGFRPCDAAATELAAHIAARRGRKRSRGTPREMRTLASHDLELLLPGWSEDLRFDERWLARLSLEATARLAREGLMGRDRAATRIATRVARRLALPPVPRASDAARTRRDLAPLADLLLDIAADRRSTQRALRAWLGAKAAAQEHRAAAAIRPLLPLLRQAATSAPASDPPA